MDDLLLEVLDDSGRIRAAPAAQQQPARQQTAASGTGTASASSAGAGAGAAAAAATAATAALPSRPVLEELRAMQEELGMNVSASVLLGYSL